MEWWQTLLISLIPAVLSGIFTYLLAVRTSNKEMEKMNTQHKLDMDKIKQEQQFQKEMKEKELENEMGKNVVDKLLSSITENSRYKNLVGKEIDKASKKRR